MKTWDDWSDFDLSLAVAKIVAIDGLVEHNDKAVHIHDYHNGVCLWWKTFWINNPADMWPIMLENGIGLVAENSKLIGATTSSQQYYEPYGDIIYSYDHVNPLRAAAIVFLMMNGVNPE